MPTNGSRGREVLMMGADATPTDHRLRRPGAPPGVRLCHIKGAQLAWTTIHGAGGGETYVIFTLPCGIVVQAIPALLGLPPFYPGLHALPGLRAAHVHRGDYPADVQCAAEHGQLPE